MQLDMHYYGTYAMARAAGLKPSACKTIATAAQLVDDNVEPLHIDFKDGGRIDSVATAHHTTDLKNILPDDQRQVWVPFHFLPGNNGNTISARMVCRADSEIAKKMVQHHLGYAGHSIGPYLLGVAAHVYLDTFSHYGFSGISSAQNRVINDSIKFDTDLDPDILDYIDQKAKRFFYQHEEEIGLVTKLKSWFAEEASGALGHGAVATYPDRPYLIWSFDYEHVHPRHVVHDNPSLSLAGCRALYNMFINLGNQNPALSDSDGVPFNIIEDAVQEVINFQGKKQQRVDKWRQSAKDGLLASDNYSIPTYKGKDWITSAEHLGDNRSEQGLSSDSYRFYQAASIHRNYVLRDLLPEHGLLVA